jgi:UTP--glucose-1-phosphate uridylyltransferase
MLVDHFDIAYELERTLAERGKEKELAALRADAPAPGSIMSVRQQVPMGLGHAIWCARDIVGDEPFAIFLPDEFMHGSPGCMAQMVAEYEKVGGNLLSVLEVPREQVSSYGVIDPGQADGKLTEVKGLVEKPKVEAAPSNLIISGRYILQPEVMRVLEHQGKGAGGEIQLTDAMAQMIGQQAFHAVTFDGSRYDCGSKVGYIEANLAVALSRPDMADEVRAVARRLAG